MEGSQIGRLARTLGAIVGRRTLVRRSVALGAAGLGDALLAPAANARNLCRRNGRRCQKEGKRCQTKHCLEAPFTIEARWSNTETDHDTYLFVPKRKGSSDPSPYIDYTCHPTGSSCENNVYPFACVSHDASGPGHEITTVRKLLTGTYEYWIELDRPTPAGDLTVLLRNAGGKVIDRWTSPANPSATIERGWHVFDIDGARHSITPIDRLANTSPEERHNPSTFVCPA
jgi:hypothetical protein